MKLRLFVFAALATILPIHAPAAADMAQMDDYKAECQKYAKEEDVPADEMSDYIAECVKDMAAAQSEGASGGSSSD